VGELIDGEEPSFRDRHELFCRTDRGTVTFEVGATDIVITDNDVYVFVDEDHTRINAYKLSAKARSARPRTASR
jgi:hypothetical protein